MVMGHEFAGVVSEVGEGVTHVEEGDRVAVEPYDVCGECAACSIGRYNICRKLGFVGLDGEQGGFAEKCVIGARWAHPLGDIPTDLGALVEPLAVAYHAVRLSGIKPGGTAAVFGSGPIGLVTDRRAQGGGRGEGLRRRAGRGLARPRRPARVRTRCSTRPRWTSPMPSAT